MDHEAEAMVLRLPEQTLQICRPLRRNESWTLIC
jgi:hypothetical protein